MTVIDASDTLLDPISPELILARRPRLLSSPGPGPPVFPKPVPIDRTPESRASPRTIELIAAYVFCLLVTLGPLGFIIAADPIRPA